MPGAPQGRPSRKADIARCFTELVADRGYDDVSFRDVAETLRISKGTIVHHFGSKDRLLEHVQAEYMERRLAEARAVLELLDDPAEQVTALVCHLLQGAHDEPAGTVTFAREIVRLAGDARLERVRRLRDRYTGLVRDAIERGIAAGSFRAVDPAIATLLIFGMCNWSWTWYRPEGAWTPDEIAATFVGVALDGLAADGPAPDVARIAALVRETIAAAA